MDIFIKKSFKGILMRMLMFTAIGIPACSLILDDGYTHLRYAPPPYENPLRGLVYLDQSPYLPQSLIYLMVPFNDFYDEAGNITFDIFESKLANRTEYGCQAVVRVFVSYRGDETADFNGLYMPPHLYNDLKDRGKIFSFVNNDTGFVSEFPDFGDARLLDEFVRFIGLFGAEYDNDPRIGFIQLGLIGNWGEWNFYPFDEQTTLTSEKCNRIYQAYQDSFSVTKLMARSPLMGDAANYEIGFHDDNFLYNTVSLFPVTEENINSIAQFQYMMEMSKTHDKWKTQAYGGEMSGATDMLFYKDTGYEYYKKSMEIFHFSFLSLPMPARETEDYIHALEATRMMGYELMVEKTLLEQTDNGLNISISLKNTGNAPFYYNWDFEIRLVDGVRGVAKVYPQTGHTLTNILPGKSKLFTFALENTDARGYDIQFAIIGPMRDVAGEYYKPLYLANEEQAGGGYITLGYIDKDI